MADDCNLTTVQQMHNENVNRMNRIENTQDRLEDKQDKQTELLHQLAVTLARVDERTAKYSDTRDDVNKAKGMGIIALAVAGSGLLAELAHIIWGKG